jgi:hypothetical protein
LLPPQPGVTPLGCSAFAWNTERERPCILRPASGPIIPAAERPVDAEPLDSNAIESLWLAQERERPRVYLPSPKEIEALKRQIRAENEAKETMEGGPPCLMSYQDRVQPGAHRQRMKGTADMIGSPPMR